jgi:segregation and condensation protein A
MEKNVPWWRKVVVFALSGLKTGFGLFRRNGRVEAGAESGIEVEVHKTVSNTEADAPNESDKAETGEASKAEAYFEAIATGAENDAGAEIDNVEMSAESSVEVPVDSLEVSAENRLEVEISCGEFENPEEEIALNQTSPHSEAAAAEVEQAAKDDPVAETKELIAQPSAGSIEQPDAPEDQPVEAAPEPAEATAAKAAEPPNEAAPATAASEPAGAPARESAPEAVPAPATQPKDAPERTTAEKVAAALKARGENAEQSPFSVLVGEVYDGPLDLLLDLIRKQDIDIYDIPIARITAQFLAYVEHLRASDMDVAGEFIYTAALLIHIKSKTLLPRAPAGPDEADEDPRRELVERLLEHERFRNAAQMLLQKQMIEAATWTNPGVREFREDVNAEPEIAADTTDLVRVFRDILDRARNRPIINVEEDTVTVGQMIQFLTRRLLSHTHSEKALIAMFLALLELVRLQAILLKQDRHFSEIFIKKHPGFEAAMNQGLAEVRDDWR